MSEINMECNEVLRNSETECFTVNKGYKILLLSNSDIEWFVENNEEDLMHVLNEIENKYNDNNDTTKCLFHYQ